MNNAEVKKALKEFEPNLQKLDGNATMHLLGYMKGYSDRGELLEAEKKHKEVKESCPKKRTTM